MSREQNLVPQLWTAFNLQELSQINLDPIIVASYCYVADSPLTPDVAFENGGKWFPQRSVKNAKGESLRLKRFADQFPDIFVFKEDDRLGECIALAEGAFNSLPPHECDEFVFRLALHRIGPINEKVCSVLEDLEVNVNQFRCLRSLGGVSDEQTLVHRRYKNSI